ncbi:3-oxoacyl-[acyl-carrier-protein] synthase III C-terminal domain-containing protein [Microscilla marina]|uniref:3-oxoacyl-acyl-carrier-protein synthase n=1 Tax=Microscilla marina ATCC 23134 TaxID=313606 RepID=A1ZS74_MICM2|nr:3-oxoacyl-[acyl-carrier-protein] synthase III C-terminal domain-containing protein [Microscilla marina]EAY26797.1 3-oxoacyl-acyl-carrier-protein synthase [Microscilla marina ATCC 23134]
MSKTTKTKPIRIVAMGKYLPQAMSSEALEKKHSLPAGWAMKYSGVQNRHVASQESNGWMGARAAEEALQKAGMTLHDIDMLISGGGTYDYPIPNQASVIKAEMKDGNACHTPAIDIDSTCLSFVTALDFAAKILDGKAYKNILIVSSEIASKGINPTNWETLTLFGDGAAATVVSYAPEQASCYIKGMQRTYSEGVYHTLIEGGGNRKFFKDYPYDPELHSFQMKGKQLLKLTKRLLPDFMEVFFADTDYALATVDAIVPHQASKLGAALFQRLFDFASGQVKTTLAHYGNCIAASIPLTLMAAIDEGSIQRGDICLLAGTSAGFAIGGVLLRY